MKARERGDGIGPEACNHAPLDLVEQVVFDAFHERAAEVTPIVGGGSVNAVFAARVGERDLIVRMSDERRGVAEYQKEAWCLERAATVGVPGPTVLAIGVVGALPYMIQTRVPGVNGKEAPSRERTRLWRELGRYARLIHSLPVTGFGDQLSDPAQGVFGSHTPTWPDFISYNLDSLTPDDELIGLGMYTEAERGQIVGVFESLRAQPFQVGLSHGDLAPRNTIREPSGRVSLLDWGCAEVHLVPHYDLTEMLRWHRPEGEVMQAFRDGYGLSAAEFRALLPQIASLQLLKAFDLVRWALARSPEDIPRCVARARQSLDQLSEDR